MVRGKNQYTFLWYLFTNAGKNISRILFICRVLHTF